MRLINPACPGKNDLMRDARQRERPEIHGVESVRTRCDGKADSGGRHRYRFGDGRAAASRRNGPAAGHTGGRAAAQRAAAGGAGGPARGAGRGRGTATRGRACAARRRKRGARGIVAVDHAAIAGTVEGEGLASWRRMMDAAAGGARGSRRSSTVSAIML